MPIPIPAKQINTTDGTIQTIQAGDTAETGAGPGMATRDHQHPVETGGSTSTIAAGSSQSEGTGTALARATHVHPVSTAVPVDVGIANAEGDSTALARANHVHKLSAAAQAGVLSSKLMGFGVEVGNFTTTAASSDSNDTLLALIIDGSFTKKVDGDGGQSGVVTDPPLNRVLIRERSSGDPIETSNNEQVYGRLTQAATSLTAATYTWNGTTTIATSADPSGELAAGEFIQLDSDGQLFEVVTVAPTQVTISNSDGKTIPTGATGSSKVDLTLSYYYLDSSAVQQAYTFSSPTTVDLSYVESISLQDAPFEALQSGVAFSEILPATHTHILANITDVTASAAEVNVLDGFLGTTDELNEVTDGSDVAAATHHHDTRYPLRSILTTKGDIYVRTSTGIVRLPVGTDDQVLVVDSAETTGVKWVDASSLGVTVARQERVTTENINTDQALSDTLNNTPVSNASVVLYLNGVALIQGAGEDYTLSGTTITWLAGTGTAPNLSVNDDLVARYESAT
jgi:hypothetical protein